jgi:hypothetical protein
MKFEIVSVKPRSFIPVRWLFFDRWNVTVKDEEGHEYMFHCWAGISPPTDHSLLFDLKGKLLTRFEAKPSPIPDHIRLSSEVVGKTVEIEAAGYGKNTPSEREKT